MPLKLKKTVMQMVAEANQEIETITAKDAIAHKGDPKEVRWGSSGFVSIRQSTIVFSVTGHEC